MYDPVKAHEYYMKHRKLKGRHSTKGFSVSQKEQWAYAKYMLGEEKKERNTNIRASISAERKAKAEQLTKTAKSKIENLRKQLKSMSKEQRKIAKERIQSAISDIRAVLKGDKANVSESARVKKTAAIERSKQQYSVDLDKAYEEIKGKK